MGDPEVEEALDIEVVFRHIFAYECCQFSLTSVTGFFATAQLIFR